MKYEDEQYRKVDAFIERFSRKPKRKFLSFIRNHPDSLKKKEAGR